MVRVRRLRRLSATAFGVTEPAGCLDDRLLFVAGDVPLRATVEHERDRTPRHTSEISHILRRRLACHVTPSLPA